MIRLADELEDCRAILAASGYDVAAREIEGLPSVLLAETLYAFVMVLPVPEEDIERLVEDAQAHLTRLAATHPSPRSWDLYLVLVVQGDSHRYDAVRETFESDTRYTRKLVVTGNRRRLEQLLRPLLPLHPLREIALASPLAAVHHHLLAEGVDDDLANVALQSFESTAEVHIP